MRDKKLGGFLQEVFNWDWSQFARAEFDKNFSTSEAIIFTLVRACAIQKLSAIKLALDRLDGKLKTPVQIEMPKVYYIFPHAKLERPDAPAPTPPLAPGPAADDLASPDVLTGELLPLPEPAPEAEPDPDVLTELSLRETLSKMSELPRELPEAIIQSAEQTEQWVKHNAPQPEVIPRVKSVVAAHLLMMAQNRNLDAITEVFDQIDGKLVETIQVLGEDIYITSYATVAPEGAVVNDEGILQIEATDTQNLWADKLGGGKK